jgi:hypothetical protein
MTAPYIELNGDDLRREPLAVRKATLASVLAKAAPGLRLNDHIEADGPTVFAHACKMGLEGIVSKRKDSPYRSGRSPKLDQEQEPGLRGREAGGGGRLGPITEGNNRIMIFGPKPTALHTNNRQRPSEQIVKIFCVWGQTTCLGLDCVFELYTVAKAFVNCDQISVSPLRLIVR